MPKRASSGTDAPAKKPRTQSTKRNQRWSAVSASANAAGMYKAFVEKDPAKAYAYMCICRPIIDGRDDNDDEDDEDDEDENEDGDSNNETRADAKQPPCDGGKTCVCHKPADQHPDHRWLISDAGWQKYGIARIMCDLREPDNFDMCTFNDHAGYGVVEVVQNLLLDYDELKPNWRDQWAVCEAMVQLCSGSVVDPMMMIDHAQCVYDTHSLIGRMFLNMLVVLDGSSLLTPDSKVQSLPAVMAQYIKLATGWEADGFMGEDEDEDEETDEDEYQATVFAGYVRAYAVKHGIQLPLTDEELAKVPEVQLPKQLNVRDPWLWSGTLQQYSRKYATSLLPHSKGRIGGDSLDLTTWSSAERKAQSFTGKDPLNKKMLDAIKDGQIMQVG